MKNAYIWSIYWGAIIPDIQSIYNYQLSYQKCEPLTVMSSNVNVKRLSLNTFVFIQKNQLQSSIGSNREHGFRCKNGL